MDLKPVRQRKYLAKDFDGLRAQILEYARLYYPDRIQDFSESSLGGLFLDMASYVGDNMSFYLDHQFSELNPDTAVELINIQTHLKNAGVPITGASPASAEIRIYIQVPAKLENDLYTPDPLSLPVIQAGSVFTSVNGVRFILLEDIDFSKKKNGKLIAEQTDGLRRSDGTIISKVLSLTGLCVSGTETSESFPIGSFVPFRRILLSNPNVSEIMSVTDSYGNIYYKVNDLTNDVVYRNVLNTEGDNDIVKDSLKIVPAPYRFITEVDLSTRSTTLIFGGGIANSLEDDIIPDPTEFAIPFVYSRTFDRTLINPKKLLQGKTQGVISESTTLTIKYRHGGALSHNVPANSITSVESLRISFPGNPPNQIISAVKSSLEITNPKQAAGGEDAPTINELKTLISSMRNSQERIVSKEDLLARVYSLPSNFGRVYRAAIRPNINNPLTTQLFIVSRGENNTLITSPDTLKNNIVRFLEPYRLISDAIEIMDAMIINLKIDFSVTIDPVLNKSIVGKQIINKLINMFDIKNFHIDQPINKTDVIYEIFTVQGVLSVDTLVFKADDNSNFNVDSNTVRNSLIIPPPGGIFQILDPQNTIKGTIR